MALSTVVHQVVVKTVNADPAKTQVLVVIHCFLKKVTSPAPALAPQLGLLGSPSDPVGRFTMRGGP